MPQWTHAIDTAPSTARHQILHSIENHPLLGEAWSKWEPGEKQRIIHVIDQVIHSDGYTRH